MGSYFNASLMLISFFFIMIFVIPSSMAINARVNHLQLICAKTSKPSQCLKHMKTASNADALRVTEVSIDLALGKAKEIHKELNFLHTGAKDQHMKDLYIQCSKNYNDAIRDLSIAKKNLHSGSLGMVRIETNDAEEEIKACKRVFNGAKSDPAKIKKINNEFFLFTEIAKISSNILGSK